MTAYSGDIVVKMFGVKPLKLIETPSPQELEPVRESFQWLQAPGESETTYVTFQQRHLDFNQFF